METGFPSLKTPRKVYLHIGSDKAGSTALQVHLAVNRDLLIQEGVYLPRIGGAAITGHHGTLFQNFSQGNVAALVNEVDDQPDDTCILMSWEGIHVLDEERLQAFSAIFSKCEFHIIYYIREQADVIQTGFLQQIKGQERNATAIFDAIDCTLPSRDYYSTVKKFERCFSSSRIEVALYDRDSFAHKNIVYDLFGRVVKNLDFDEIRIFDSELNSSLYLDDVIALARMEKMCPELLDDRNRGKKSRVIDLLLHTDSSAGKVKSSHFLSQQQVAECRRFYRESNERLISEYGIQEKLVTDQKPVWILQQEKLSADSALCSFTEAELLQLLTQADTAYLDRDSRQRYQLELSSILQHGWVFDEEDGSWSSLRESTINGAIRQQSRTPLTKYLRIFFIGEYFPGAAPLSAVYINGDYLGDFDLRASSVQYPLEDIAFPYTVSLRLVHIEPPEKQGNSKQLANERALYFRLKKFVCTFARKLDKPPST